MDFVKIETVKFEKLKELQKAYKVEIEEDTPTEDDFICLLTALKSEEIIFCRNVQSNWF